MIELNLYIDGGSRGNPGPAASACLIKKDGQIIVELTKFLGNTTNNVAEYTALLIGLDFILKQKLTADKVLVWADSQLMVQQLCGKYKLKSPNLIPIFVQIKDYESQIKAKFQYNFVPREQNKQADLLVNKEIDRNLKNINQYHHHKSPRDHGDN